jgi:hypothetical protein
MKPRSLREQKRRVSDFVGWRKSGVRRYFWWVK